MLYRAKLKFFLCFEAFLRKLTKASLLGKKNCFSHPNEPHTAKLSSLGVWKLFCRNLQKKISLKLKKCFSHQNKPHTAKLGYYYEAFFSEIDQKNLF